MIGSGRLRQLAYPTTKFFSHMRLNQVYDNYHAVNYFRWRCKLWDPRNTWQI